MCVNLLLLTLSCVATGPPCAWPTFFLPQHLSNENLFFQFSQNEITAQTHKLSILRCDGNETSHLAPTNTGQVIRLSAGKGGK